jgi:hypothetical protein
MNVIEGGKAIISDEIIEFFLYDQEGNLQSMRISKTRSNELFVRWIQCHDRYSRHETPTN